VSKAILGKPMPCDGLVYCRDRPKSAVLRDGDIKTHIIRNEIHVHDLSVDIGERRNLTASDDLAHKRRMLFKYWLANMFSAEKVK
jgi:hypothetical protein